MFGMVRMFTYCYVISACTRIQQKVDLVNKKYNRAVIFIFFIFQQSSNHLTITLMNILSICHLDQKKLKINLLFMTFVLVGKGMHV